MRGIVRLTLGLAVCLAFWTTALGQTSRGTLTGTVTDDTGAVIRGGTVTMTQDATAVSRKTTTNEAGIYRFDSVDLGSYTVMVQAQGFATTKKTGVNIEAARVSSVDFALKIGAASDTVTVEASATEVALDSSEQTRGSHFETRTIQTLPVSGLDPLTLAALIPGTAVVPSSSINQNGTFQFSVNGQRPRGNNFMIDGVENNDISVTGPSFTISNPDAVQEVSVQTSNFSAEFGRAGGAVFNEVTKSGTNQLHGSAVYQYDGSAFSALSHNQKNAGSFDPPRLVENIPWFTIGGPLVIPHFYDGRNKTFFFAAGQWDSAYGTFTGAVRVPQASGITLLQSMAGTCPNAALYLQAIGNIVGSPTNAPSSISIAVPSAAGTCTGSTRAGQSIATGLFQRSAPLAFKDNNHQVRVDHVVSDKQTLSFRWLYDSSSENPDGLNNLPGFDFNFEGKTMGGLFSDTYIINSRLTNEFRFNYGRIGFNFPLGGSDTLHNALQSYSISGLTGFGEPTNIPQFRFANNWQYQDTMSWVRGKHTFRFGGDFLRQLARQHPPFNERGSLVFGASTGVTALANFLDDFGGNGGSLNRQFGASIYHPNLFRQSYFFQDSWKANQSLTLNLGLRYENFGTPVNDFAVAAFTDYDPVNFAAPHAVNPDNNNFAPSVGFAYNPRGSGRISHFLGGEKTVIRGGFQTSYDAAFNNLLSNIAGSSPNTLGGNIISVSTAGSRGAAAFTSQFGSIVATPATKESAQQNLFLKNMPNPYTNRWSFGFERELPYDMMWDASYVGSESHKLYRTIDMNPIVNAATGDRLHTELQSATVASTRAGQGIRTVRAASANSNYHSLQIGLKRRFKSTPVGPVQLIGQYTYSKFLDDVSDVFAFNSTPSSFQSVSQVLGASPHIDFGPSDFDRRHVGAIGLAWQVRAPRNGVMGQILGGWELSTITRWNTGLPYTVSNGTDRNGDGQTGPDRPDISNISAPLNTRAVRTTTCATGFANPDASNQCIDPATVHFIEATGNPNAKTVGRNTLRANGFDNVNLRISKTFKITERSSLSYACDMFNALNVANFIDVPSRTINGTVSGAFLDTLQQNDSPRTMQMRVRLTF